MEHYIGTKSGNDNNYANDTDEFSLAVDELQERKNFNIQDINDEEQNRFYSIKSYTPKFSIDIEYNCEDGKGEWTLKSASFGDLDEYVIEGINFGIVKNPIISLGLDDNIINIKITNTQGNIIMEGNPYTQDIKYLNNLDKRLEEERIENGSAFVSIEINNEEIYGSRLEITYGITVINNSDLNFYETQEEIDQGTYKEGDYYIFGEATEEASITINMLHNYLDKKLTVVEENDDEELPEGETPPIPLVDNMEDYKTNVSTILDGNDPKDVYTLIITEGWKPQIYTQKNSDNKDPNKVEEDDVTEDTHYFKSTLQIVTTKTLAQNDKELYFVNQAEVKDMEVTGTPALIEDVTAHSETKEYIVDGTQYYNDLKYVNYFDYTIELKDKGREPISYPNPSNVAVLTIIPPTGFDTTKVVLYSIVAIVSGIIISIGIIIIRKKVL